MESRFFDEKREIPYGSHKARDVGDAEARGMAFTFFMPQFLVSSQCPSMASITQKNIWAQIGETDS